METNLSESKEKFHNSYLRFTVTSTDKETLSHRDDSNEEREREGKANVQIGKEKSSIGVRLREKFMKAYELNTT